MKFKARIISLISLILMMSIIFSGCSLVFDKNEEADIEQASEDVLSDEVVESEVYYNQGENLVEMKITQAKGFEGGYAYLTIEDPGRNEYNAITDKNGNITFFQEKYVRGTLWNSNNGYFYFYQFEIDDMKNISCVNYNGEEIYKIELPKTENVSMYFTPVWGDDGSVLLCREVTAFDYSGYEIAWVGGSGDFILDWNKIETGNVLRQVKEVDYCGSGFAVVHFFEGSPVFVNLKTGYQCTMDYIDGEFVHGEFMEGYMAAKVSYDKCFIISETGEKVNEISNDNWDLGEICKGFDSDSSHALVLNSKDYSLYDSSMTRKVTELKIPETAKKGEGMVCWPFINSQALLVLPDSNQKYYYFTVIDTEGNMNFEPKRIPAYYNIHSVRVCWDGEYIMTVDTDAGVGRYRKATVYDLNGNIVKEVSFENEGRTNWYVLEDSLSEGVVTVNCDGNYCYLKTDGTYLFENGTVSINLI